MITDNWIFKTHYLCQCSGAAVAKGIVTPSRWDCHAEHASSEESLINRKYQVC